MRYLVDTNVFIDFIMGREPFFGDAKTFFKQANLHHDPIYMCGMSLRDIEYHAHRISKDAKLARRVTLRAYEACSKVVDASSDAFITAIYEDVSDYEDAVIMTTAELSMCDVIVTNNKRDFKNSKIPCLTPREINSIYMKQKRV